MLSIGQHTYHQPHLFWLSEISQQDDRQTWNQLNFPFPLHNLRVKLLQKPMQLIDCHAIPQYQQSCLNFPTYFSSTTQTAFVIMHKDRTWLSIKTIPSIYTLTKRCNHCVYPHTHTKRWGHSVYPQNPQLIRKSHFLGKSVFVGSWPTNGISSKNDFKFEVRVVDYPRIPRVVSQWDAFRRFRFASHRKTPFSGQLWGVWIWGSSLL